MELIDFHSKLIKQYSLEHNNIKPALIDDKLFKIWLVKRAYQNEIESTYNLDEDALFKHIEQTVLWYYKFGSNANPDELLDRKDKLVTFIYWLSEKIGRLESKYEHKMQHNKIQIERTISLESKKIGTHAARAKGKSDTSSDLLQESQYKGDIKEMERMLDSLDKIVAAMQQRIAWLRQEANKSTSF